MTHKALCSPDNYGHLDYSTGIINLTKYSSEDKKTIKKAITPTTKNRKLDPKVIDATCLVMHEITHYLDLTTTLWGIEFLIRRDTALGDILEKGDDAASVAMLNVSEILMHEELVRVHEKITLENLTMTHSVVYNDKYGAIIIIRLEKDQKTIAETALSMLSLLEANAVAHEIEAEIKWFRCTFGELSNFHEKRITSKLEGIMRDPLRLEYNILHLLVSTHFPRFSIHSKIKLIMAIAEFSLNISGIDLSALANTLNRTFKNQYLGDSICNDLCRGMSRHVVAFKLILLTYQYAQETKISSELLQEAIIKNPETLINDTISHFGPGLPSCENNFSFSDLEFCAGIKLLRARKGKFEPAGQISAIIHNRRIRKRNPSIAANIRRFRLPDLLLDDHTRIKMRTRLRFNIVNHWDGIYYECDALNRLTKKPDIMRKFHMKPGAFGPMQHIRIIMHQINSGQDQI